MPSISKLKEHLLSLFRPNIKSMFNIYDPIGLRCIFQLRLRLSPLRSHKWRHNFIETTSNICICNQGIEDNEHFLFSCPLFMTQRTPLITTVNEIVQKNNLNVINQPHLYLYGHQSLNDSDNKKIILSTIKFIKDTTTFHELMFVFTPPPPPPHHPTPYSFHDRFIFVLILSSQALLYI